MKIVGSAGFSGLSVLAPNANRGLALLLGKQTAKSININRLLYDLKRQRLIEVVKDAGEIRYTLTPAGAYRLLKLVIDEVRVPISRKWDKRWRLVAFDIPIRQSRQRQIPI